jgi:hypothetical protein
LLVLLLLRGRKEVLSPLSCCCCCCCCLVVSTLPLWVLASRPRRVCPPAHVGRLLVVAVPAPLPPPRSGVLLLLLR